MAYSDYGGYAYRDGRRVIERSDAWIDASGQVNGTPGIYPPWGRALEGGSMSEAQESPLGHVMLGDGPVFLALYKQGLGGAYRGQKEVEWSVEWGVEGRWTLEIDGRSLEFSVLEDDNLYAFARLVEPGGVIWHGWSGYGVGAGLEDCGYGFSTEHVDTLMRELWPGDPWP